MRVPQIVTVSSIIDSTTSAERPDDRWLPARPYACSLLPEFRQFRLAWRVFTGMYDALDWEEDGEKETGHA